MVAILNEMLVEAIDKVLSPMEYATRELRNIREKVERGEELNQAEKSFLEGYLS